VEQPRHLILIAANTVQLSIRRAYQPINSTLIERLAEIRDREFIRIEAEEMPSEVPL
jgi:hypothetical protein